MKKFTSCLAVVLTVFFLPLFSACFNGKADKTTYEITAEFDENTVTGVETVTFFNDTENAFSSLKFNLFANAFRKDAKYSPISAQYYYQAYGNKESYGDMQITFAKSGEKDLEFNICGEDANILEVILSEEVFPGESTEVTVGFVVNLAEVIARTGVNAKTVNLANFYPVLCGIKDGAFYECVYYAVGDPFFSDVADYKVTFTAQEKYVVAASGKELSRKTENGKTTAEYSVKNARSFAIVLSEEFKVVTDCFDSITVNYYYYEDEAPDKSLADAVFSLKYFSETFGKYPYETFSVVQTKFIQGGMEFTALTFISDALENSAYREVIIHETAHQWWQVAVGNNEITHPFIDEGLAEYSVILFYENHPEYGFSRKGLIDSTEKTYKTFCSVYQKVLGKVDTVMTKSLKEYKSEYEYVNIAYIKSCIMWDYLRQTIGDSKFFAGLKRLFNENKFSVITEAEIVGAFEREDANSNGFFKSFFDGSVII